VGAPIEIETERLVLRPLTAGDAGWILELLNDPAFLRYIGDKGVRARADACRYIETGPMASYERHGFGLLRVELKDGGEPIGMCGLLKRDYLPDVDIGFALLPAHRSKGYTLEAASAVLGCARDTLGLERVLAITSPDNVASIGLIERLGFRFERMARPAANEPEVEVFSRRA